jgi:SAM-dependent methyltransferase
VVTGGRLHLRDEERLLCYDVLQGSKPGKPAVFTAPPPAATIDEPPARPGKGCRPDAIYVPTPQDVVEKMLELAKVRKTDTVVDLGCGDGRIVVTAARQYGCKAIGYDIDPECVRMSRENVARHKVGGLVTVEHKDLFTVDLRGADVVALYLPSPLTGRLLPQLGQLRPGARVVSHAFAIPGLAPDREVKVLSEEDGLEHKVFLYTAPLRKAKGPR